MVPSLSDIANGYGLALLSPLKPHFNVTQDPRVEEWFLMTSPYPTLALTVLYLAVVKYGPSYMADKPAYSLKNLIICYNLFLVILSAYMSYEFFVTTFLNPKFDLWCSPVDRSPDPDSLRLAKACWWYYFSKVIEFCDTFFFILRKKNNQVSFLHVYHHSTMFCLWWVGVRYVPGGCSYFSAFLNSGVHVLMYTYYMLSAMGPQMSRFLWWKRYITVIQLAQFWMILFHTSYAIYINCSFPKGLGVSLILYMLSHIALFSNFYSKAYKPSAQSIEANTTKPKATKPKKSN